MKNKKRKKKKKINRRLIVAIGSLLIFGIMFGMSFFLFKSMFSRATTFILPPILLPILLPECGDGHLDPGEECDDGNDSNVDDCSNECRKIVPPNCDNTARETLNGTVDHFAVMEFRDIPEYWLDEAKNLSVLYGHTSYGSEIISGLMILDRYNSDKYAAYVEDEGNAQANQCNEGSLDGIDRLDGFIQPTGVGNRLWMSREGAWPCAWWSDPEGLEGTKELLRTGYFDVAGWAWCGQVSACPAYLNCDNNQYIDDYLAAMEELENEFPDIQFFYMTGHTTGCAPGECPSYDRIHKNNKIIRDYCRNNNKVLFDFADIESHDSDGCYYSTADGTCTWCRTWCDINPNSFDCLVLGNGAWQPNSCGSFNACKTCDTPCRGKCAHSGPYGTPYQGSGINCLLKGKAFWWMMARLAGWSGPSGWSSSVLPEPIPIPIPEPIPIPTPITYNDYFWRTGRWDSCTINCGTETVSRKIICENKNDGSRPGDSYCDPNTRPSSTKEVDCGECSTPQPPTPTPTPAPTPTSYEDYFWRTGRWGSCTIDCGTQTVSRRIICEEKDDGFRPGDSYCDPSTRPPSTKERDCGTCSSAATQIFENNTKTAGGFLESIQAVFIRMTVIFQGLW